VKKKVKITERLAKLIDVKSLTTFALIGVFCALSLRGRVTADQFMVIATAVITFYFAKRENREEG